MDEGQPPDPDYLPDWVTNRTMDTDTPMPQDDHPDTRYFVKCRPLIPVRTESSKLSWLRTIYRERDRSADHLGGEFSSYKYYTKQEALVEKLMDEHVKIR